MSYFDVLIEAYDAHVEERESRGEPEWRAAYRSDFAAALPEAGRVLEVGAGVGFTAQWFAEAGFDVTATDLSPGNVAAIRAKGVAAEVRNIVSLGFRTESFDGIWAASCLMHIANEDLPEALGGIARILRPGGWFWAGTWGGEDSEGIWENDWYEPKRFYSFRSDDTILAFYEPHFDVVSFETIEPESATPMAYQIALMQPRSDGGS